MEKTMNLDLTEKTLSEGDVCELAGVVRNTLRGLVANGILQPTTNAAGPGNHRLYSILDTIAVAYGAALRDAGCGYDWMSGAVRFIANQTPGELKRAFARGYTLVLPLPDHLGGSRLLPGPKHSGWPKDRSSKVADEILDLEKCFRRVLNKAAQLRVERNERGRNRGLAG